MRDTFAAELMRLAGEEERVMFLTGDLGFGVFEKFLDKYPNQYLNVGVAEQNMIAVGTGLALEGRTVFAYSIGNFPVLRCLEQIRNDAAYHGANVKIVSIGGGFSYGPLGPSHHATEDLAILRAIPDVRVFVPATLDDVVSCVREMGQSPGTDYLRLDKSHGEETPAAEGFRPGSWRIMNPGEDVALVAAGGILGEVQKAAAELASSGVSVQVVNPTQMSQLKDNEVLRCVGATKLVITVEEHVITGGLGGLVAESLASASLAPLLLRLGITDGFMSEVGSQAYLRRRVGIDSESIIRVVQAQLDGPARSS